MYEFISHTWNTVKGECPHGCRYCYMKRWGKQNLVRFDKTELQTDLGRGNKIFVGSSCDLFAEGIPEEWITKTLRHALVHDNLYLFQSKNPKRIYDFIRRGYLPLNGMEIIGTTLETNYSGNGFVGDIGWAMGDAPRPQERADWLEKIAGLGYTTMVTIEPIMDFDLSELIRQVNQCKPFQVNIGANTGRLFIPEPGPEKIRLLLAELGNHVEVVHKKKNLDRLLKK